MISIVASKKPCIWCAMFACRGCTMKFFLGGDIFDTWENWSGLMTTSKLYFKIRIKLFQNINQGLWLTMKSIFLSLLIQKFWIQMFSLKNMSIRKILIFSYKKQTFLKVLPQGFSNILGELPNKCSLNLDLLLYPYT